jgi:magnesium-transporting ATPase (P-type)
MFLIFLTDDGEPVESKLKRLKNDYKIPDNKENKNINLDEIGQKIRRKQGGKDLSIIVDGINLEEILINENLSFLFFNLAVAAKSVLCCRMNPSQKSKIVKLVKTHGKWVTLAIGDGVNDVPMIMEAHIGVGIQGKEGSQAVRNADFSIGQFRFLNKLLLIYGRVGYIKISKFICYYFYKNILLVFNDIIFSFLNGFSGQLYFADYLTTMYNAIFTSWCCIFVFSFEKDVELNLVKKFPTLYEAGQKNYFFNITYFWKYILYAILHCIFCFLISQYLFLNIADNTGITFNHWQKSTINFSLIIHVVTYKLLIISDFWNLINLSASLFSLLLYYIIVFALSCDYFAFKLQNELAGIMVGLFKSFKFWIVIIFGPFIILVFDITMKQILYNTFPNPTEYIKQQLNNQVFKSLLFNEDEVHKLCESKEAKQAENKIKEILRIAREKARLKKTKVLKNNENIVIK